MEEKEKFVFLGVEFEKYTDREYGSSYSGYFVVELFRSKELSERLFLLTVKFSWSFLDVSDSKREFWVWAIIRNYDMLELKTFGLKSFSRLDYDESDGVIDDIFEELDCWHWGLYRENNEQEVNEVPGMTDDEYEALVEKMKELCKVDK